MSVSALSLRSFGVAFGEQVVLSDVSFELATTGMTVLVGTSAGGKSTLVRTLAGLNDGHPSLLTWGSVVMNGAACGPGTARPALVVQKARFFLDSVRENLVSALPNRSALELAEQTQIIVARLEGCGASELVAHLSRNAVELPLVQQRRLAIVRALMTNPAVLMVDEATVGLDDLGAANVIAMLRQQAQERAVMFVTHNQRHALAAGGKTMFLANGTIHETAPTDKFFTAAQTELGRHFLRTGGATPALGVPAETVETPPPPVAQVPRVAHSRFVGPRGFFWIVPGQLGGMPRPGMIDRLELDLEGLQRLGITTLVTLEETQVIDPAELARFGLRSIHFPIVDMDVPTIEAAIELSRTLSVAMAGGEVVTLHCRAGMGRTGTLLACQLIFAGETASAALDAVRAINPRCVQSAVQVDFLRSFANALTTSAGRSITHGGTKSTETETGDQENTWR